MSEHPQLALNAQLCLPLYAASRGVTRRYAELLAEVGLTYPQYVAMLALWERPRRSRWARSATGSTSTPAP